MCETSVIIPQHGRADLTRAAVESCLQFHPHDLELIVVDDGSRVSDLSPIRNGFSGSVSVLRLPRRGGVTAAWNAGAKISRGRYLIFLNNDTTSTGNWIPSLLAPLVEGSAMMTGAGWRHETAVPNQRVQVLAGWCLGIRKDHFEQLGEFDERFALYFSDTDIQLRVLQHNSNGLKAVLGLPLRHLGHCSTRQLSSRSRIWKRDRMNFLQKWPEERFSSCE